MTLSVQLGLLFALATALSSILGFLYKHRGAVESPAVEWRRPIHSTLALFRSRWYTLGLVIAMGSWGFHVAALSLAPISLVQSTIAGGLVLLTVVADRLFGFTVTRREWIGVALTALGLAFLAATLAGTGESARNHYDSSTLAIYVSSALGLGVAAGFAGRGAARPAIAFAASAGLLWGGSDVSIKALSGHYGDGLEILVNPLAAVIAIASFFGLLVSARSLQLGQAVPVIAVTSATANVVTIASGVIVFGEPLPGDALGVLVRLAAFALVIVAAALTPAPVRAARAAGVEP